MKDLSEYIMYNSQNGNNVEEGLISNTISLAIIKTLDEQEFITGILNMYDYICDESDMELFYQDFPMKQRPLWKTLYKMYEKKVWSIFDVEDAKESMSELSLEPNIMQKVTVPLRRDLRKMINDSRNSKLELKPAEVDEILPIYDEKSNKTYIITLNRTTGILKRIFRATDIKFLEAYLKKFAVKLGKGDVNVEK